MNNEMMTRCCDMAMECQKCCLETIKFCLQKGGKYCDVSMITKLMDCAQMCSTTATFCASQSDMCMSVCDSCAKVCEDCAKCCEMFSEPEMKRCAEMLRKCVEMCKKMGKKSAIPA